MSTLVIISGYTKGIGRQLIEQYIGRFGEGTGFIGISRSQPDGLISELQEKSSWFRAVSADLGDSAQLPALIQQLDALCGEFESAFPGLNEVMLVNNAAILGPMNPISRMHGDDEAFAFGEKTLVANCVAPTRLAAWFMDRYAGLESEKKTIITISSGASIGPMPGAAFYSMSKAAVNMICKSIAVEESGKDWPFRALAVSPGMVETGMQELIRSQTEDNFPSVGYFRHSAETGKVRPAAEIAALIAGINPADHESGSYVHVKDL